MKKQHKRDLNDHATYQYKTYEYQANDYQSYKPTQNEYPAEPYAYEQNQGYVEPMPQDAYSAADFGVDVATKQTMMHASKRRSNHLFVTIVTVMLVVFVVVLVTLTNLFRLQSVYVEGNLTVSKEEIVYSVGLVQGLSMLQVDVEDMIATIETNHMLSVNDITIDYLNCAVYIQVIERIPVAIMKQHGMQYVLDITGMVLEEESQYIMHEGLPIVTGFSNTQSCIVGQTVPTKEVAQLIAYQQIMSELILQDYCDQISEINVSDSTALYLVTIDGDTVRLADWEYMRAKIGAVRTCIPYIREQGITCVLDVSIPEEACYLPM